MKEQNACENDIAPRVDALVDVGIKFAKAHSTLHYRKRSTEHNAMRSLSASMIINMMAAHSSPARWTRLFAEIRRGHISCARRNSCKRGTGSGWLRDVR
jgi:hypothetical protein